MGGWLSRDRVEEMLESMDDHGMISDELAVRARTHLDAGDVEYALRMLTEFRTGR